MINTYSNIHTRNSNEIIVFNTPGSSTIGIRTGKIMNLYSESPEPLPEVKKECATLGLEITSSILENKTRFILAGKSRILISNCLDMYNINHHSPDILILTGSQTVLGSDRTFAKEPGAIIITSGATFRNPAILNNTFTDVDTVHFVQNSGAFIRRIIPDQNKKLKKLEY